VGVFVFRFSSHVDERNASPGAQPDEGWAQAILGHRGCGVEEHRGLQQIVQGDTDILGPQRCVISFYLHACIAACLRVSVCVDLCVLEVSGVKFVLSIWIHLGTACSCPPS
jgi:hypothetical protein